jgi:ParB family transcriptional regulator, chromosome partitioning protein
MIPSEKNIRKRKATAIKAVKTSIELYGYNVPIIVDKNNVIVAGHTRHAALQELYPKDQAFTVISLDPSMTEEDINKVRLADNKIGEASEWDTQKLGLELRYIHGDSTQTNWQEFSLTFPDTSLIDKTLQSSVGKSLQEITTKQVETSKNREENKYKERPDQELIPVTCPNCGYKFHFKNTF